RDPQSVGTRPTPGMAKRARMTALLRNDTDAPRRARITVDECGTATRTPQTLSILRRGPLRERGAQLFHVHPLEKPVFHFPAIRRVIHEGAHPTDKSILGE